MNTPSRSRALRAFTLSLVAAALVGCALSGRPEAPPVATYVLQGNAEASTAPNAATGSRVEDHHAGRGSGVCVVSDGVHRTALSHRLLRQKRVGRPAVAHAEDAADAAADELRPVSFRLFRLGRRRRNVAPRFGADRAGAGIRRVFEPGARNDSLRPGRRSAANDPAQRDDICVGTGGAAIRTPASSPRMPRCSACSISW